MGLLQRLGLKERRRDVHRIPNDERVHLHAAPSLVQQREVSVHLRLGRTPHRFRRVLQELVGGQVLVPERLRVEADRQAVDDAADLDRRTFLRRQRNFGNHQEMLVLARGLRLVLDDAEERRELREPLVEIDVKLVVVLADRHAERRPVLVVLDHLTVPGAVRVLKLVVIAPVMRRELQHVHAVKAALRRREITRVGEACELLVRILLA